MRVIKSATKLMGLLSQESKEIGFVPTMGALHEGHASLIKRARKENELVVVSVFVNPTQFLEGEDLDAYPRTIKEDSQLCEAMGVDILFTPEPESIYEDDELAILAPQKRGFILEGNRRPGHFDGMLQVVMKLLNITRPTRAYFGKKDAQQLALVTQMVRSYFMNIEIVGCDIVREENGLALSSRNRYLNEKQKVIALGLSGALFEAKKAFDAGQREAKILSSILSKKMQEANVDIEYAVVVDREFNAIKKIEPGNGLMLVAGFVGTTRLIDNLWV